MRYDAFAVESCMTLDPLQMKLLSLVRCWVPNERPERRAFRCGWCGESLGNGAWHFLLRGGGYFTPVHLCGSCHQHKGVVQVELRPLLFDRSRFHPDFSRRAGAVLDRISERCDAEFVPGFHQFTCDQCRKVLPGGIAWHTWRNRNGVLMEYHFCDGCLIGISDL